MSLDRATAANAAAVLAALAALALVGVMVLRTSSAAFTATTENAGNSWDSGSVVLTDSDAGTAMFAATNLAPGDTITRCITVTYGGSITPAQVRLYGQVSGQLASYLDVEVNRGTRTGTGSDCGTFTPTTGQTSFTGKLNALPTTYAAGTQQWSPTAQGQAQAYQMIVRFPESVTDPAAQNQNATATFTWEAQEQQARNL